MIGHGVVMKSIRKMTGSLQTYGGHGMSQIFQSTTGETRKHLQTSVLLSGCRRFQVLVEMSNVNSLLETRHLSSR